MPFRIIGKWAYDCDGFVLQCSSVASAIIGICSAWWNDLLLSMCAVCTFEHCSLSVSGSRTAILAVYLCFLLLSFWASPDPPVTALVAISLLYRHSQILLTLFASSSCFPSIVPSCCGIPLFSVFVTLSSTLSLFCPWSCNLMSVCDSWRKLLDQCVKPSFQATASLITLVCFLVCAT